MLFPAGKWHNPYLIHWLLPAGLLGGVMLFDLYFLPGAIITPVCSFLILALLAFILPPVSMIFWACVYSCSAVFAIWHPDIFRPALNGELIGNFRSVGVLAGASFAVVLCFNRLKVSRKNEQLNLLVKEIPVPFVLSDGNGEIILMNTQASQLLGVPGRRIEGESYFSLLTDINRKGDCIQKYLELFDMKSPRELTIELKPQNNPGVVLRGTLIPADADRSRYLITVISEPVLGVTAAPAPARA
jgi:PAS domain-containing protein